MANAIVDFGTISDNLIRLGDEVPSAKGSFLAEGFFYYQLASRNLGITRNKH